MNSDTGWLTLLFTGAGCAGAVIGFGLVFGVVLWLTRRR